MQRQQRRRSSASSKKKPVANSNTHAPNSQPLTSSHGAAGQSKPRKSGRRRIPSNASSTPSTRSTHSLDSSTHESVAESLFSTSIISDLSGGRRSSLSSHQPSSRTSNEKQAVRSRPRRLSGSIGGSSSSKDSQLRRSLEAEAWKGIGDLLDDSETVKTEDILPDAIFRSLAQRPSISSEEDSYMGPRQRKRRPKQYKEQTATNDEDRGEESSDSEYHSQEDENDSHDEAMKKLCGFMEHTDQLPNQTQMPVLMDSSFSSIQTDVTDAKSILSYVKGNQVVQPTAATAGGPENAAINDFLFGITTALQRKQEKRASKQQTLSGGRKQPQKPMKQHQTQQRRLSQNQKKAKPKESPQTSPASRSSKEKGATWTAASGSPAPAGGRVSMIKKKRNESPTKRATETSSRSSGKINLLDKKKSESPNQGSSPDPEERISFSNLPWLSPTFSPEGKGGLLEESLNNSLPSLATYRDEDEDDTRKKAFQRSSSDRDLRQDFVVATPSSHKKPPRRQSSKKGSIHNNPNPSPNQKADGAKKGSPKRQSKQLSNKQHQRRGSASNARPAKQSGKQLSSKGPGEGKKHPGKKRWSSMIDASAVKNAAKLHQKQQSQDDMALASSFPTSFPVVARTSKSNPADSFDNPDRAFDSFFPQEPVPNDHASGTFASPKLAAEGTPNRFRAFKKSFSKKKLHERNEEKFFPDFIPPEAEQQGGLLFS